MNRREIIKLLRALSKGSCLNLGRGTPNPLNSPLNMLHDRNGDSSIDYLYSLPPSILQYLNAPSLLAEIHSSNLYVLNDNTNIPGQSPTSTSSKSTSE